MTFLPYLRAPINLSLAAIIGYYSVALILHEPVTLTQYRPNSTSNTVTSVKDKILDVTPLLNAYLFGKTTSRVKSTIPLSPPETQLSLHLRGIFFIPSGKDSMIMIAEDKGKSQLYKLNAVLSGGAIVYEIREKEVILLRNGRYETLKLEGSQSTSTSNTDSNQLSPTTPIVVTHPTEDVTTTPPEQLLGQFQRQLQTNPESLMQLMKINPMVEAGRFLGYQLSPGKNPDLMAQFNLQTGDILTKINEVTLDSPLKGLDVLPILATADTIDLQILRNGQTLSLSFPVQR